MSMSLRLLPVLALGLTLANGTVTADVVLDGTTKFEILERGDFGDAAGRLRSLLEDYLDRAFMDDGSADDASAAEIQRVRIVIEASRQQWASLPNEAVADPAQIDAFEVNVSGPPAAEIGLRGNTVRAAGFAVMHFIETRLGFSWAMPGELGICQPKTRRFVLQEGRERITPAMISRVMTGFVLRDPDTSMRGIQRTGLLHQARDFFFAYDYFKALKMHALASPSHNMIRIVAPPLADVEPEVFPWVEGKRWVPPRKGTQRRGGANAWQSFHPCYSAPRLLELTLARAEEAYAAGKCCFSLGINDGKCVRCECEACTQAGFPDSYYRYVEATAKNVAERWPGRIIGLIAYGDVKTPPSDLHLPANVLVMVVGGGPQAIDRWSQHAELVGTYEHFFGMGWWYPNLPLASMEANAGYYAQRNVRCYRGEWHPLWAWDGPRVWIGAKLLWDPHADVDALLSEYCRAAFGAAAVEMEAFYREFARLREGWVVGEGVSPLLGPSSAEKWCLDPLRQFAHPPEVFSAAAHHMEQAVRKAEKDADAKVAQRVRMVNAFFEYGETTRHLAETADRAFDPTAEAPQVEDLRVLLRQRTQWLDEMQQHPQWFAGTAAGVDETGQPLWFDRPVVDIVRMAENAILAAEVRHGARSGRAAPARLLVKRSHAWYEDQRKYLPLSADASRDVVHFASSDRGPELSNHPTWTAARKQHWMAALVRDVPSADGNALAIDVKATGKAGRLTCRATVKSPGGTQPTAMALLDFGNASSSGQRRLLVESRVTGQRRVSMTARDQTSSNERRGRDRGNTVDIHLIWHPSSDAGLVSGSLEVELLHWKTE
jgi:hypothetical protein